MINLLMLSMGKKSMHLKFRLKKDVEAAKQQDDNAGDKRKVDEDGDDEDDSGNWKRQKKSELPIYD